MKIPFKPEHKSFKVYSVGTFYRVVPLPKQWLFIGDREWPCNTPSILRHFIGNEKFAFFSLTSLNECNYCNWGFFSQGLLLKWPIIQERTPKKDEALKRKLLLLQEMKLKNLLIMSGKLAVSLKPQDLRVIQVRKTSFSYCCPPGQLKGAVILSSIKSAFSFSTCYLSHCRGVTLYSL